MKDPAFPKPNGRPNGRKDRPEDLISRGIDGRPEWPELPMDRYRDEVVECVRNSENAVIIGETGSGKTTRIPDFLLDAFPEARIAITQPRRVAARSVARYVAARRGVELGSEIGYQVRFDDVTTEGTRANFMTDGILLRKLHFDPLLQEYDIVMVDEAHERNLNIDFVLGLLKRVQAERKKRGMKELKVIATSATIEKKKFTDYFGDSPSVDVPGRMFPVDVQYESELVDDYTEAAAKKVQMIVDMGDPGDILIFMPGEEEIRKTLRQIEELKIPGVEAMPLYGAMAPEDQDRIFAPSRRRKVIVSTNIAETSVTIDGIRFVIDSGVIKQKEFNPESGIEALVAKRHAKSGCEQRKGRAGRTAPGTCYRLYTEQQYEDRDEYQTPEIARSNLDHVILAMKKIGIDDVRSFEFIDPPAEEAIVQAIETLKMLGALDEQENLTPMGETMAELPLLPEISRMVIESEKYHCTGRICTIAAMISGDKSVFVRPKEKELEADVAHAEFAKEGSDFMKLLEVWKQWSESGFDERWARDHYLNVQQLREIREIRYQLMSELRRHDIPVDDANGDDPVPIQKCIISGLIQHLMIFAGRHSYHRVVKTDSGFSEAIFIHPSSVVFHIAPQLMIGAQVVKTSKTFARRCQPVKGEWLPEIVPQLLKEESRAYRYDPEKDEVVEEVSFSLRGHYGIIARQERPAVDPGAKKDQFVKALVEGAVELPCVKHNDEVQVVLHSLYARSGGEVRMPDLTAWYRTRIGKVANRAEALAIDDQLRMEVDDFCPAEMRAEIEARYPEKITIQGHEMSVAYAYQPDIRPQFSWVLARPESFKATITIPAEALFGLHELDFIELKAGAGRRLEIYYRIEDESLSSTLISISIDQMKEQVDRRKQEKDWISFKKPEPRPVKMVVGQPFPTLESLGITSIPRGKDYKGEQLYAYPAYHAEQVYDYTTGHYVLTLTIEYFRTEELARDSNERTLGAKTETDERAQRKIDRETMMIPARTKQAQLALSITRLSLDYSTRGMSHMEFMSIHNKWTAVEYALVGLDADPRKALRLMEEIEADLRGSQEERERRIAMIDEVRARLEEMTSRIGAITLDNYRGLGISNAAFFEIKRLWREVFEAIKTEDPFGSPLMPNPQVATSNLDRIEQLLAKKAAPRHDDPGLAYRRAASTSERLASDVFPYPSDYIGEREPAVPRDNKVFAGLLDKMSAKGGSLPTGQAGASGGQGGKAPKEEKPAPAKEVVPKASRPPQPKEKEPMTDELRKNLGAELSVARYFLEVVREVVVLGGKASNAEKIAKARAKAADLKRELNELERELATTDDAARAHGKIGEMARRAARVAEEMARAQGEREDWPEQFKSFMAKLMELAVAQGAEIDDAVLQKVRPKVVALARLRGSVRDLDGELETIIIDSI